MTDRLLLPPDTQSMLPPGLDYASGAFQSLSQSLKLVAHPAPWEEGAVVSSLVPSEHA